MDDYIGGADTEEQTIRIRQSLTDTLEKACLHIPNWASNRKVVMNDILDKLHENKDIFLAENDHSV